MEKPTFKKICFMSFQKLTNFPYIENDFDALTNYEIMCKIVEYLNQVIANNNEQNKAIQELVNFFENLNVQDEINNKLDEMAQSGELEEIISIYLNSKAIFGFDTKNDMLNSQNLVDGSYAKTLGNINYKDGDGSLYKIREITNDDVVDNDNITAMNTSNTLIAEKIPNYYINNLQTQITNIDLKKTIFIGDSFGEVENSWCDRVATKMGLSLNQSYFKFARGGAGFCRENNTFLQLLQENESVITNKNEIRNVIVCGGTNDYNKSIGEINNAIASFCSYVNTNYPNAHIYVGMIGWYDRYADTTYRNPLLTNTLIGYRNAQYNNKSSYLNGVEYVMHYYDLFQSDGGHPTDLGQKFIADAIYQSYSNGIANMNTTKITTTLASGLYLTQQILNNDLIIYLNGALTTNLPDTTSAGVKTAILGTPNNGFLRNVNDFSVIPVMAYCATQSNGLHHINGVLKVNNDGQLILEWRNYQTIQITAIGFIWNQVTNNLLFF